MSRPSSLTDLKGIGDAFVERLRETGIETPADVAEAGIEKLTGVEGISTERARNLKEQVVGQSNDRVRRSVGTLGADDWTVTEQQAAHVESLGIADASEILDAAAADLRDVLEPFGRFQLPFFRRVCGRVVAPDPESGDLRPVPNATVTVYDTDCSFLGYFPDGSRFTWFYPFGCSREEIGRTRTDECGCFCVYVPWWDVDRVLRYRFERVCLPEIVRPRLGDLLGPDDGPIPEPRPRPRPRPGPWPGPDGPRFGVSRRSSTPGSGSAIDSLSIDFEGPGRYQYVEGVAGREVADELLRRTGERAFGTERGPLADLLRRPAFIDPVDPPLPPELRGRDDWVDLDEFEFGVDPDVLDRIDPNDVVGPLLRCRYVPVREWETVFDVPDITFEVTQDTDGDGTEETIYSEGYFDVRWNEVPDGSADDCPPGDPILRADPTARTIASCRGPGELVCTEPSIVTAEDMSLQPPYHESDPTVTAEPAAGYQRLVNRPQAAGSTSRTPTAAGEAPYAGPLQLHGCSRVDDATHYRVVYRYKEDAAAPDWSATQPFTGLEWSLPVLFDDDAYPVEPGANGWYENLTVADIESHYGGIDLDADELSDVVVFPYLLLQWPTGRYPNGRYDLRVQVGVEDGSGGMTVTDESDPMPFVVDNSRPTVGIESLEWWHADESPSSATDLLEPDPSGDPTCPVISREEGTDVRIEVGYRVSAPHLRDMSVHVKGCSPEDGPRRPNPSIHEAAPPNGPLGGGTVYRYWHTDPDDTSRSGTVTFTVDADDPDGSYTVALDANSRAYNPGTRPMNPDWNGDAVIRDVHRRQGIAIVTE